MVLKIEVMGYLCELLEFTVNGIDADYNDFGDKYDDGYDDDYYHDTEDDEGCDEYDVYGCDNMQFHPKNCTNEILKKYRITEDEYGEICEKLSEKLSFGSCGYCN